MKLEIDFEHPYINEERILALTLLHRFQQGEKWTAAAKCAFLLAYYVFIPLTPPASCELAIYYIDIALEWNDTPEYREWKNLIERGN